MTDQAAVETMVEHLVKEQVGWTLRLPPAVYDDREPFHLGNEHGRLPQGDRRLHVEAYMRASANVMIKQGQGGAVVIVSCCTQIAFPNCMAYNMAKAALDQMPAPPLPCPHKIKVNIIYPTDRHPHGNRILSEDALKQASKGTPMGRLATADEIPFGVFSWSIPPRNT